ncbi:MAG: GAF domain-containing protein [Desulfuromonadales bacterium]|nr:GAF domain-containing protein [Desulfuromonadales bacterium]NIR33437.1 GAF domain-containing protein [Desulfuromonadales bacterium]NIS39606.1 GAF domain-containing protein [Desulfuromonadales bacterium]
MGQRETTEFFGIFFEASRLILSSSSKEETLDLLVKGVAEALGVQGASLRLVSEKTGRLELAASYRLSSKYLNKGPLDSDKSVPEVLKGEVVLIKNAPGDPRIQYRDEMREEGIDTMLSVPVVAGEEVIGVLRLYLESPRDFSEEEIEFASALAELGGLAIINARVREEKDGRLTALLKEIGVDLPAGTDGGKGKFHCFTDKPIDPARSLAYFRTLHDTLRTLLSTLNSRDVMALIVDKLLELEEVDGCALRLVNETTRELELVAAGGLSDRFLKKGPLHADRSIRETLEGAPMLIADAGTDPRIEYPEQMRREGIISILSLPIIAMDRVLGVLRLYSRTPRHYNDDEVAFLSALAEIAGIVIMNARLHEQTEYDLSMWTATLEYFDSPGPP